MPNNIPNTNAWQLKMLAGYCTKFQNVAFKYKVASEKTIIQTLESGRCINRSQIVEVGDYIMTGVEGEVWGVKREEALEKYDIAPTSQSGIAQPRMYVSKFEFCETQQIIPKEKHNWNSVDGDLIIKANEIKITTQDGYSYPIQIAIFLKTYAYAKTEEALEALMQTNPRPPVSREMTESVNTIDIRPESHALTSNRPLSKSI